MTNLDNTTLVNKLAGEVEEGIRNHQSLSAIADLADALNTRKIDKTGLESVNAKLHKDGYLPEIDITGADSNKKLFYVHDDENGLNQDAAQHKWSPNLTAAFDCEVHRKETADGSVNRNGIEYLKLPDARGYELTGGMFQAVCSSSTKAFKLGNIDERRI